MKTYQLQIDGQPYEVTVAALDTNPVQVTVNGELLEVWLQGEPAEINSVRSASPALSSAKPAGPHPRTAEIPAANMASLKKDRQVLAPIPGVITDLHVMVGQSVNPGESLCSLEAMKMKNIIRASRPGVIADIHVTQGQHVFHQQLLMEYAGQDR